MVPFLDWNQDSHSNKTLHVDYFFTLAGVAPSANIWYIISKLL